MVANVLFIFVAGFSQAFQESAQLATASALTEIQLSYKRDPRTVDPFRGFGPWVSGPSYAGATGQDTVEVRAEGVDTAGRPAKISPQWIPSDRKMVTVSPSQGDDVKITVHRAGESKLKITYRGLSKELVLRAKYVNKFFVFEIVQSPAVKPNVSESSSALQTRKEQVNYAAGMSLAKAFEKQSIEVDVDLVKEGLKDALSGRKTLLTEEQARESLSGVETDPRIIQENLDRSAVAENNKREGEAFLAQNKKKPGVVSLPDGLQYKIIKAGKGKRPTANDAVKCRYRGTFVDGTEFQKRGASVTIPLNSLIKGLVEVVQRMPVGSNWRIVVPSDLAYGDRGSPMVAQRRKGPRQQLIGPNVTLIFELELLSIQPSGTRMASQKPSKS